MSAERFVLFPIGEQRFALPASVVSELAKPGVVQNFPHSSPLIAGVLVRRGGLVAVCDVAHVLVGPKAPARRFYLIASRTAGGAKEQVALPVTGDCELLIAESTTPNPGAFEFVSGMITSAGANIDVLDLELLLDKVLSTGMLTGNAKGARA